MYKLTFFLLAIVLSLTCRIVPNHIHLKTLTPVDPEVYCRVSHVVKIYDYSSVLIGKTAWKGVEAM